MRLTVQYENEDGVKKGRVYGTSDTPTYKVRVTAAKRGHRPYLGRAYRKRFIEIEFTFDPPGEGQAREGFGSAIAEVAGGTITLPETRAKPLLVGKKLSFIRGVEIGCIRKRVEGRSVHARSDVYSESVIPCGGRAPAVGWAERRRLGRGLLRRRHGG